MENTITIPIWGSSLSDSETSEIEGKYGKLARDFESLANLIEKADRVFQNNTPSDETLQINPQLYDGNERKRLTAVLETSCLDEPYAMIQSQETHKLTAQILNSVILLHRDMEKYGIQEAKEFYVKLCTALRYGYRGSKSVSYSGTTVNRTGRDPGWVYVGRAIQSIGGLMNTLHNWKVTIIITMRGISETKSKTLLNDLIDNPEGVDYKQSRHGKDQPYNLNDVLKDKYPNVKIRRSEGEIYVENAILVKK